MRVCKSEHSCLHQVHLSTQVLETPQIRSYGVPFIHAHHQRHRSVGNQALRSIKCASGGCVMGAGVAEGCQGEIRGGNSN